MFGTLMSVNKKYILKYIEIVDTNRIYIYLDQIRQSIPIFQQVPTLRPMLELTLKDFDHFYIF